MEERQARSLNGMPELPHDSPGPSGVDISQGEQGGRDEEDGDEQLQGDDEQDQDMGCEEGEDDEDDLGSEAAEDALIESLGNGCDVAEAMGPELAAEVRLMEWDERM
jgi:hypothetical protein